MFRFSIRDLINDLFFFLRGIQWISLLLFRLATSLKRSRLLLVSLTTCFCSSYAERSARLSKFAYSVSTSETQAKLGSVLSDSVDAYTLMSHGKHYSGKRHRANMQQWLKFWKGRETLHGCRERELRFFFIVVF